MKLSIHSLPFFLTSLLFFGLSCFVFFKGRRSAVNRSFFILGLSITIWQFSYFIVYNLKDTSLHLSLFRIAYSGLIFIAPAIYHFVAAFLNLRNKKIVYFFYLLSLFGVFSVFRGNYIVAGVQLFTWGAILDPGSFYSLFLAVWSLPLTSSIYLLYRAYHRSESPYNKKRIKYVLGSLSIASLALVDVFPILGFRIYPFGFIFLIISGFSTAYSVVRYRLLNIEIVVKKASLLALGFASSISIIYLNAFYLQPYFYIVGGNNWIIFPIVVSLFTGIGLFRFINFVRTIEEDELSKKFSYRPILKREAQRVARARNLNELIVYTLRDLSSWMRLSYVGIFIKDVSANEFSLAKEVHRAGDHKNHKPDLTLDENNPLVIKLRSDKKPLICSEIEYYLKNTKMYSREQEFLVSLIKEMKTLGAEVSIPSFCEEDLLGIINLGNKINVHEIITAQDLDILVSLANNIGRALQGFMLKKEKIRLIVASQRAIISAIEAKDFSTHGHTERVAGYASLIGEKMKENLLAIPHGLSALNWSAQLHDVGKIAIADEVLFKPSALNEDEWAQIREHPFNGIRIVSSVREWLGEDVCSGILEHHENYDGSGYPFGKKGEAIHIFARIIRTADAFDVMTTTRPYRPALTKAEAMEELRKYKGVYFDPLVVEVVEDLYKKGEV
ncbi:MAG: HD domain-containing protein [Candidatus Omnitrophica bacterium]|nr:HD domain-containing protein [Candidatus Omnitrophota bacterium]